ncbi:MAG: DUF2157 domain-containing protein [Proteobacteria bacterium]|nr:DUF2157 domain-containing protein [Pseudomonadota bacterium]
MSADKDNGPALETIPADRRMIDGLLSQGLISPEARNHALGLLYPARNWGLWASRMLLALGVSLILSGIVYFFAFNWARIAPGIKLGSIQLAMFACLALAFFFGLTRFSGKIAVLSGAVLTGVFLAVFGQIYQTGADAYSLFMVWALLILPWVILAEFAALWLVWLVICNVFLMLYWDQAVLPERADEMLIFSGLALFSAVFLGLREYVAGRGAQWLQGRWTRAVLVVSILGLLLIPAITFIMESNRDNSALLLGAALAVIFHVGFYLIYRFRLPDIWALAVTAFSGCIIVEAAIFKVLTELLSDGDVFPFLLIGLITLGLFAAVIARLRAILREMEAGHV